MSNSVNFYEFIGFVTFIIPVHVLIFVYMYSFLLARKHKNGFFKVTTR